MDTKARQVKVDAPFSSQLICVSIKMKYKSSMGHSCSDTKQIFICSKSTIETQEKGAKYVQS